MHVALGGAPIPAQSPKQSLDKLHSVFILW